MEANELKIGNWVRVGDVWYKIYSIHSPEPMMDENFSNKEYVTLYNGGLVTCLMSDVKGIPLSEEWLEKFGFDAEDDEWYILGNGFVEIGRTGERGKDWYWDFDGKELVVLQHVHQLQNLYFALTGEELEIKETV